MTVVDIKGEEIEIEAFHPGEFLKEEIEERKLVKKDVAKAIKILPHHLSEIFAGKRNITPAIAVRLEKLMGISASYWMCMQIGYDLYLAKKSEQKKSKKTPSAAFSITTGDQ